MVNDNRQSDTTTYGSSRQRCDGARGNRKKRKIPKWKTNCFVDLKQTGLSIATHAAGLCCARLTTSPNKLHLINEYDG